MSVTALAATYLFYTLKTRCHKAFRRRYNICIVWILSKMLCSKVIATFSDHHGLLRFLSSSRSMKETVAASFQED